ncbi:MAG: hypothetical protein RMK18_04760 [Armatimonadota bacterium]|nr:hypothetical protein [Armatimonadota bacterium]MCX7777115.1 hypothetical protein [Armatimonadota bacterium]MDW8025162.1 hypothetical protein [Armatimonadota bacterium]
MRWLQIGLKRLSDEALMRIAIWLTLLLCAAFGFIVACPAIPLGVVGEWVLERKLASLSSCIPMMLAVVLIIFIAWRLVSSYPKSIGYSVFAHMLLFIPFIMLKLAAQMAEPPHRNPISFATYIAVSPIATSYFTAARDAEREGWLNVLQGYDEFMRRQPVHAATHPPGMLMLYSLIRVTTYNSSWLQHMAYDVLGGRWMIYDHIYIVRRLLGISVEPWELAAAFLSSALMLFMGALALPFVIYGALMLSNCALGNAPNANAPSCDICACRVWLSGAFAAMLYSFSPGQLAYGISPDQALTFISAVGAVCICVWMIKPEFKFALALCGVVSFVGVICSFKFLPVVGVWVIWIVGAIWCASSNDAWNVISKAIKSLLWLVIPMLSLALLFAILFNFDWLSAFSVAMRAHSEQAASATRTYWKWAIVNLIEFGISLGPATVALLKICFLRSITRMNLMSFLPSLSSAAIILLLDVFGVVRGEVSRIWLPFMPMLIIGVASGANFYSHWHLPFIILSASQAAIGILVRAMVDSVRPW